MTAGHHPASTALPIERDLLLEAVAIAAQARANGNHPFGALLADPQGLYQFTGEDVSNLTLELPCRTVFDAGRRQIAVRGPFELDEARAVTTGSGGRADYGRPNRRAAYCRVRR